MEPREFFLKHLGFVVLSIAVENFTYTYAMYGADDPTTSYPPLIKIYSHTGAAAPAGLDSFQAQQFSIVMHAAGFVFLQLQSAAQAYGSSTAVFTLPSMTFGSGHLICICTRHGTGGGLPIIGITDTLGNTYHHATDDWTGIFGGESEEIWYAYNSIGGTGQISINWGGGTGSYANVTVCEYSGALTYADPLDAVNAAHPGASSGPGNVGITTFTPNALIFGEITAASGDITTTSLTDRTGNLGGGYQPVGDQKQVTPGATAVTTNNASQWMGLAAAFKPQPAAHVPYFVRNYGSFGWSSTNVSTMTKTVTMNRGNIALISVKWGGGSGVTVSSVTDSAGNTWHPVPGSLEQWSGNGYNIQLWYAQITTGGNVTITVNWTGAAGTPGISGCEWGGIDATTPIDSAAAKGFAGVPAISPILNTVNANTAIWASFLSDNTNDTAGTGWTQTVQDAYGLDEYQIESAVGGYQATVTPGGSYGSQNYVVAIVALKGQV